MGFRNVFLKLFRLGFGGLGLSWVWVVGCSGVMVCMGSLWCSCLVIISVGLVYLWVSLLVFCRVVVFCVFWVWCFLLVVMLVVMVGVGMVVLSIFRCLVCLFC